MATQDASTIKALVFDVFGTVVDWRSSIARQGEALGRRFGFELDWASFADAWRAKYQPAMQRVRSGERAWTRLDDLHREGLVELIQSHGLTGLSEADIDDFSRAWHRLDPWPDSAAGLTRLKRSFIIGTLSNGNIALLTNMAKHAGLPWDVILGAEPAQAYKPLPQAYLKTCYFLDLEPAQVMLVAAHNDDLAAARSNGLRTAFVARPHEYGPAQVKDVHATSDWDYVADSFTALADQLGCA
ncbi:MAG: haloacid dehalogenase type II [Gammaproteobacteria bacterium]|nr:haloacid dehalogenase type II [Gammaproteobacteria bacterium]